LSDIRLAFFDLDGGIFALWPPRDLAAELGLAAGSLGAYHGFALAHNLPSAAAVDALFKDLAARGARITKPPAATDCRTGTSRSAAHWTAYASSARK